MVTGEAVGDEIEIRLELPRARLQELNAAGFRRLAEPVPLPPDPDAMEAYLVEPVSLVVAVSLAVIVERVAQWTLARLGQGTMVDMRERPPAIRTMAGVPQGFVVLIHPDGRAETIRADEPGGRLSAALSGLFGWKGAAAKGGPVSGAG